MVTREQAKTILIQSLENNMKRQNKTLDDYCVMSPKKGKNAWSYKECIESINKDECLEDSGNYNLIDSYLHYLEYKEKQNNGK